MNVLFLMADELRADVTGFMGNPIIRTPNLDALAQKATIFSNAYTASPVCIPARQCITSGKLPTTCGCVKWLDDLEPGTLTFPRLLSQNGYETVACGKLHHVGPDQMQGYTKRLGMDMEVVGKYIPNLSKPYDVSKWKWTQQKEVERATDKVTTWHIRQDEVTAECAEYFIEQYFEDSFYERCSPERPLLLTVSFNQPHYPYVADPKLMEYYLDKVTPYMDEPVFPHSFLSLFQVKADEPTLRRATAAYYAMIEKMDSYIGRIVKALERVGQNLDDWMIIFTTDHGEMLGQHGIWEKQKFFEASARVPLFIQMPNTKTVPWCHRNVNLCDLYATIMRNAGIELPEGLDSRDLTPLMLGDEENWDNETICIYDGNIMVKKDALKYQYYREDNTEVLFDLEADPTERTNLIQEQRYEDFVAYGRKRIQDYGFTKVQN